MLGHLPESQKEVEDSEICVLTLTPGSVLQMPQSAAHCGAISAYSYQQICYIFSWFHDIDGVSFAQMFPFPPKLISSSLSGLSCVSPLLWRSLSSSIPQWLARPPLLRRPPTQHYLPLDKSVMILFPLDCDVHGDKPCLFITNTWALSGTEWV